jgi:hypothetical protein
VTAAEILTAATGAGALLVLSWAGTVALIHVDAWRDRTAVRVRVAARLDEARQAAALAEIERHRARIELDLDDMHAQPAIRASALDLPADT